MMIVGKKHLMFQYLVVLIIIYQWLSVVESYQNHTVGDSLGWYDTLENPNVDYKKWVSTKNFSLGDYLIFNTDNNHSVIQTYNSTTYKLCDYDDSADNDTIQWSLSNPSAINPQPVSIAVPLVKEGITYFFSSDYDGEQCKYGQHFEINVMQGIGLPPSLRPDNSPAPESSDSDDDDDAAPETLVPANFDNPIDTSDDDNGNDHKTNQSVTFHAFSNLFKIFLVMLWFEFSF